jgi:hypothetical protein
LLVDKIAQNREKKIALRQRGSQHPSRELSRRLRNQARSTPTSASQGAADADSLALLYGYPLPMLLLYEEIDLAVQLVGRKSVPTRSISY